MEINKKIKENKIIAIIRKVNPDLLLETAKALFAGGIRLMEITFDQSSETGEFDTSRNIEMLSSYFGDKAFIGAGTVMTLKQVEVAIKSGARYIISPNSNLKIIQKTVELGVVSLPGAFTPSEIVTAYENGASFVKVFPAGSLGPSYIKSIRSSISHIPLLAVGGVNENNLTQFMECGIAGVGVGSSLVKKELINNKKFDKLILHTRVFVKQLDGRK